MDFLREGAAQAGGVEEGASAEDARGREVCELLGEVGKDVNGVGDQEEDGGGGEGGHVGDGGGEDGFVAADEVGAGFAWE